jgi:uncharacterized protein YceK
MKNIAIKISSLILVIVMILPLLQGCSILDTIIKPHQNHKKRKISRHYEQKQEKEQPEKTGTTIMR